MGIPIWSPKKQRHEQLKSRIPSRQRLLQAALLREQPLRSPSQLQRRLSAAGPYFIETDSTDGYINNPQPEETSSIERQSQVDRQMEQRFNEKSELLDQLKITAALLDQFIAMTDLSSQGLTLPPFITDDLIAILTATSATLNTSATHMPSSSSSSFNINSNNNSIIRGRRPIDFRSLRSYNSTSIDTTLTNLVDTVIRSPSHAARWAELESDIVSIHQRVIDQLILLGAGLSQPTQSSTTPSSSIDPSPLQQHS